MIAKNKYIFALLLAFFTANQLQAQFIQTIRGQISDKNTGIPLIGATIVLINSDPILGTITDEQGNFRLEGVPVGRQGIQVDYLGYHRVMAKGLDITSGKEFTINVEMEESVIMGEEVMIKARSRKDQPLNDFAIVSARSFRVEDTERYAGSYGDPARMAANFAGVQSPADQSNDIIIRGNSPAGLLWKLEGVNVYNPNHFGSIGSTGGPVSMLNNNVLSNSDFYSGAFSAEFGNALSGVFDLRLRSGNSQKREFTIQTGFNGWELGVEGPFSKKHRASYIASYRYSSLALFDKLGLNIGLTTIPYYQDLSFKIDIPGIKNGRLTLFGLGGINHIGGEQEYVNTVEDFRFGAENGTAGLSYSHYMNEKTRLRTIFSVSGIRNRSEGSLHTDGVKTSGYGENSSEVIYTLQTDLRRKLGRKDHLMAGIELSLINAAYRDSLYMQDYDTYYTVRNTTGSLYQVQSYLNWKHKFSDDLQLVTGIHYQQLSVNRSLAVEPRVSMAWNVTERHELSAGYGLHSQMQPRNIYFTETLVDTLNNIYEQTNLELGYTRSNHFVVGHQYLLHSKFRVKTELYYQYLYDVPVTESPSYKSVINYGSSFTGEVFDSLVNEGTARNVGAELTVERYFTNNYYCLVTLSLFDSKYKASDGVIRNTAFNGTFIMNGLGGYEFQFRNQDALAIDGRISWAGGLRIIPIDIDASRDAGKTVYDYSRAYEPRDNDYFRIDLRISYKLNRPRSTWTFTADIQNITNHVNPFYKQYNPETDRIEQVSQIGIIPAGLIRVNF